jgi:hypothetical protein
LAKEFVLFKIVIADPGNFFTGSGSDLSSRLNDISMILKKIFKRTRVIEK